MIDIIKAKEFYKKYISNYNPKEPRIALKIAHIYRTAEKARWLAEKLKLSEEDVLLAELIGLLHDIGRFEQVKTYNTLLDKISVNHAEYGGKVLFEDNLIRNFIEDKQYDDIIKKAILNHNKNKIDNNISDERELLHCKIIRDADKLDIYYALLIEEIEATYPLERYKKEPISKDVKEEFMKNHIVNYSNVKTCADLLVGQIGFIFDINYIYSLEKINNEEYLEKLIERFNANDTETINDLTELKEIAKEYIKEKIKEGEICLKSY